MLASPVVPGVVVDVSAISNHVVNELRNQNDI